ncbi:MAG TPA: hypothetical protein VGD65_07530 [Chryseosolibacter sp.]
MASLTALLKLINTFLNSVTHSNSLCVFTFLIYFGIPIPAFCQIDSVRVDPASQGVVDVDDRLSAGGKTATIAMFIPASILTITHHEIGHTILARLCGDKSSTFYFYKNNSLGFNEYDHAKLTRFGNTVVSAGGIMFSQSLAHTSDLALRTIPMSPFMQRTTAMIYVVAKFDQVFQVFQGILKSEKFYQFQRYERPSGTDMVDFSYYVSNGNHKTFLWVNVGLVTLSALDVYLCRNQIKRNWQILFNRKRFWMRRA